MIYSCDSSEVELASIVYLFFNKFAYFILCVNSIIKIAIVVMTILVIAAVVDRKRKKRERTEGDGSAKSVLL